MATIYPSVTQLVTENSAEDFLAASNVLLKFASNVLENPLDNKYRRIRISNPVVQTKLLTVTGGMECLFEMGFEEIEDGEFLLLPQGADLQLLKNIKDALSKEMQRLNKTGKNQETKVSQTSRSNLPKEPQPNQDSRLLHSYLESEAGFLSRMKEGMKRVLHYERPLTQQKARSVIPTDQLHSEAKNQLQANASKGLKLDVRDYLLLALLDWFKKSFFSWVDTLECSTCKGSTANTGSLIPSEDDVRWGAGRVEAHTCSQCGQVNRFPRYTNAEKLLETRRGRCGEWADCFTLCCRALGFEARYIMDWTDHVWTEVYSESQTRWLHCDPCENICDKPLLYESGWGKKLTYVIACSCEEIQDVTWRYSAQHSEVLSRRRLCRETWLRRTIHKMWLQKLSTLPRPRQQQLWHRLMGELSEFITIKSTTENLPGRTTGSLDWRQARGELGTASSAVANKNFIFSPTTSERESELIHVVYSCASDRYIRKSAGDESYEGWQACTFSASHVFRKEEHDWKMVYLAREEGSDSAEVTWKFDLRDTDLRMGKMQLRAATAVYESGSISWRVCAGEQCFTHTGASLQHTQSFDLGGCQSLTVTVLMEGGKGDTAWQHTQLFRQPVHQVDTFPFEIKLYLN